MKFLGNILFRRYAEWERRKYMKMTIWVVLVATIFAVTVGAIMLFEGYKTTN
jgi:hypothetical protein